MKYFISYSDQEIKTLTTEQIQQIILENCEKEGISIPTEPRNMGVPFSFAPDVILYYVEGCNFAFTDKAIAEKLNKFMLEHIKDARVNFSSYNSVSREENPNHATWSDNYGGVKTTSVYSTLLYTQYANLKDTRDKLSAEYKAQKEAYDIAIQPYETLVDEVFQEFHLRVDQINNFDSLVFTYRNYLNTAEGDMNVATRFFRKFMSVTDDKMKEIEARILEEDGALKEEPQEQN